MVELGGGGVVQHISIQKHRRGGDWRDFMKEANISMEKLSMLPVFSNQISASVLERLTLTLEP